MPGVLVGIAVIAFLILFRILTGMSAERRLRARLSAYRAAGEPVEPVDFVGPEVPDEENAAVLLRLAGEEWVEPRASQHPIQFATFDLSHVAKDLPAARQLLSDNAAALQLIERACRCLACEWNLVPAHDASFLATFPIRQLVKLLAIAALVAHQDGDDEGALRSLRQAQKITDFAYAYPVGVGLLIALTADLILSFAIEYLSPAMRLERDGERALAREWIHGALDEAPLRHARRRAFLGERAFTLDVLRALRAGIDSTPKVEGWPSPSRPTSIERVVFGPLWTRAAIRSLDLLTDVAEEADSYELLRRRRANQRLDLSIVVAPVSRWFRGLQAVRHDAYFPLHSHMMFLGALARRRMAAAALALRLFHANHGHLPDTLAELVPQYLTHVPLDPLAPAPAEIHYRPRPEPPVLYSVGRDGRDNGGRIALDEKGLPVTEGSDDLFYLRREDRPRRPLPPLHVEPGDTLRGEGGVSI